MPTDARELPCRDTSVTTIAQRRETPGPVRTALYLAYGSIVAALVAYVALLDVGLPLTWTIMWCVACAALAFAPVWPWVGVGVYSTIAYGTARYGEALHTVTVAHVLDAVVVLAFVAAVAFRPRGLRDTAQVLSEPLALLMLALTAWIAVGVIAAVRHGALWNPYPLHSPVAYLHGLALFLVARLTLDTRDAWTRFGLVMASAVVFRGIVQGRAGVYLENDIAPLAVMVAPLLAASFMLIRHPLARGGIVLLGVCLFVIVMSAQNRGAGVAAVFGAAVTLYQSARRRWTLGVLVLALLAAAIAVAPTSYGDRFRELWAPGSGPGSGEIINLAAGSGRIELWQMGLEMVRAHPVLGVGPGQFPVEVMRRTPDMGPLPAHNNLVHMAAEAGLIGLALYVALFAFGVHLLNRVRTSTRDPTCRFVAGAVRLSLLVYLVAGMFISRQDMVLAYVLLGWAAALSASVARLEASRPD
jgi:O-antigen ligase